MALLILLFKVLVKHFDYFIHLLVLIFLFIFTEQFDRLSEH